MAWAPGASAGASFCWRASAACFLVLAGFSCEALCAPAPPEAASMSAPAATDADNARARVPCRDLIIVRPRPLQRGPEPVAARKPMTIEVPAFVYRKSILEARGADRFSQAVVSLPQLHGGRWRPAHLVRRRRRARPHRPARQWLARLCGDRGYVRRRAHQDRLAKIGVEFQALGGATRA